ncbi:hypothetical protein XH99_02510 [Bradyrhizobium nanningense]|uniref:Capsule synthesis protein CapA domain-containing protein n=1 Tax=Bradyrhizobium nanningense TaxID=1325118 RepID=A0A4Q0SHL2_9BRAD|nr:hypothetical protein XH99_02510 [Bradyrhizobium nanningense]
MLRDRSIVKLPNTFEKNCSLTVSAAGDLIQADGIQSSKDILFERIGDILFDVDISTANYESPVTEQRLADETIGGGRPLIMCCSPAQFLTLTAHKGKCFTALNTANNHIFDLGIRGLETTQRLLGQNGTVAIGTPRRPEEYGRGKILTKGGIKVGFISATFGLNGHEPPASETYRVHVAKLMSKHAVTDLELLRKQIEDCKQQGCDFIIASIHWGYEFEFFPRHRQVEAARALVEQGVDLILGHHPHVIQPIEYYRTKRDPNRIAVIAYSLGSLTWGWYTAPHLVLSMILKVNLSKGLMAGARRTYIENIMPVPVFRAISYEGGERLMRIEKLHDHLNRSLPRLKQMKNYVDLVLGT